MQLVPKAGFRCRSPWPGLSLLYPLVPLEMKENHHQSSALLSSQAQHISTTDGSGPSLPSSQQEDQPALHQQRASQRREEGPTRPKHCPHPDSREALWPLSFSVMSSPRAAGEKAAAPPFVLTVDSRPRPPVLSTNHDVNKAGESPEIPHPGMKNWAVWVPWTEVTTHLNGVSVSPAHGQRKGKSIYRQQALNCLQGEALTRVLLCRKVNWGTGRWSARGYMAGKWQTLDPCPGLSRSQPSAFSITR